MKRFHVMMLVAAVMGLTSTAFAQQQRGRGFDRGSAIALLMIDEVQDELKLTDEQKQKLQSARGERGSLRDLSREERRKRIAELRKKSEETIKTVLDEKQQKRLEELRIQREGAEALAREEVAAKVGLEQAQKDQIKKALAEGEPTERFDFRNATQEERQKYSAEARERRQKTNAALLAVLKPAQKETFEKLQGEKFDFPRRGRNRNR